MCCWRRMEKNISTEHVRNEEVLRRDKEERNILQKIKGRKVNSIGHILSMNCILKDVMDGKIEGRIYVMG
jgi:hypothetical protein